MTGIYFLIDRKKVVYIGATHRYPNRIKQHPDKQFTSHRFIECLPEKLASYEKRWIAKFKPKYNMSKGSVKTSKRLVEPSKRVVLVGFYVQQSIIDLLGGMEKTRELAKQHIEQKADVEETGRYAMHG